MSKKRKDGTVVAAQCYIGGRSLRNISFFANGCVKRAAHNGTRKKVKARIRTLQTYRLKIALRISLAAVIVYIYSATLRQPPEHYYNHVASVFPKFPYSP